MTRQQIREEVRAELRRVDLHLVGWDLLIDTVVDMISARDAVIETVGRRLSSLSSEIPAGAYNAIRLALIQPRRNRHWKTTGINPEATE